MGKIAGPAPGSEAGGRCWVADGTVGRWDTATGVHEPVASGHFFSVGTHVSSGGEADGTAGLSTCAGRFVEIAGDGARVWSA
ncbi:hypothetical protein ACFYPN_24640 [Streptomyces sp. NPDC005576]|uniref:hypothetical protein n=1 Tax=unclassified Streptomyces TaxID=2593676 RepID=UPI00340764FB